MSKKELKVRHVELDNELQELGDKVVSLFQNKIKNNMKNEVPSSHEVGDSEEDLKQLSVSLDIDFKKISKIFALVIVIIAGVFVGTTFKTPLPKVDQDLIQATNNLRGLEKIKIEYASGTNSRTYKIQVLEKEIVDIGVKNVANDGEIEKTKSKIEKIINAKVLSNIK